MPPAPLFADAVPLLPNWRVLLTVAVGAAGVYVLLPRPRGYPARAGVGLVVVALALAFLLWLPGAGTRVVEAVLFYGFSTLAIVGGVLLVTQVNPARGAISFALVVLSTCGLFLLQGAPFLMAGTIIIYAGAIIVTFLFVIMLAQQHEPTSADARSREPLLACLAGFFLLATLLLVLGQTYDVADLDALLTKVDAARRQATADEIRRELGDEGPFTRQVEQQADLTVGRRSAGLPLREALDDLKEAWPQNDPAVLRARLDRLYTVGARMRATAGSLPPPEGVKLSAFSGPAPGQGPAAGLPAENVAALGRSLYSDFLLAVELGGTLLLIATIGAIAIVQRPIVADRRAA
jgi:NADH:ubiquinone oxidoreductase subunit 6 (subunit J)